MSDFEVGGPLLGRVHRKYNDKKYFCHFTGFLEGIAASGFLEIGEVEPLVEECLEFLKNTNDGDAYDIIEDFKCDLVDHQIIDDFVSMRVPQIDAACHKSSVNRFLGYCRGIACDGVITIREAEGLLKRLEDSPAILETTGVRQIFVCATDAIADGILDAAESEEICAAISRVVGDCYADTGIAGINKTAVFDEFRLENLEVDFLDARIVLTGKFKSSPRSEFERELEAFGATFLRSVSKKTDFLVVGGEASRDWIEQNRGTKMRKAEELRIQGSRPLFVSEAQILRFLRG